MRAALLTGLVLALGLPALSGVSAKPAKRAVAATPRTAAAPATTPATPPAPMAASEARSGSSADSLALTIYNNDLALVQDTRSLDIPAGRSRQEFPGVSAMIRAETVTLTAPGIGIVEQNFDYDLLSPDKLMEKAVGQQVTVVRTNPATGAETRELATVLAVNGGVVLRIGSRIEVLRDDGLPARVIFDKVPENLRARPTLSVLLESARGGPRPATLSYLTPGLGWKADYVALFDEAAGKIDVQGWVTLTNTSGTTYAKADTVLVAGNPSQGGRDERWTPRTPANIREAGTESGTRARLGNYYLYPLPEPTTIADRQTKQVSFLDARGASARKAYEYRVGWLSTFEEPQSFATVLLFSNAAKAGLGDQLPAGTVRVYMRDASGQPQFIGENQIGHTPMGSQLAIKTGDAFDVKVRAVQETREKLSSRHWRTRMRYTLSNARDTAITADLIQDGLWGDARIEDESLKSERRDADSVVWHVPVPANGETEVTATFDTRW